MKKPPSKRTAQLTKLMHRYVATGAVGASTGRRMIPAGRVKHIRKFLSRLRIEQFSHPERFHVALDKATDRLTRHKPKCVRGWGAARKFINIFLRNATYNSRLRREYNLSRIERLLEIPLDRFVADGLRGEREGRSLPDRFVGVIHVNPELNEHYQAVATAVAQRKGTRRVHLDLVYWRREKKRG